MIANMVIGLFIGITCFYWGYLIGEAKTELKTIKKEEHNP